MFASLYILPFHISNLNKLSLWLCRLPFNVYRLPFAIYIMCNIYSSSWQLSNPQGDRERERARTPEEPFTFDWLIKSNETFPILTHSALIVIVVALSVRRWNIKKLHKNCDKYRNWPTTQRANPICPVGSYKKTRRASSRRKELRLISVQATMLGKCKHTEKEGALAIDKQ